jgi:hypothetical protein
MSVWPIQYLLLLMGVIWHIYGHNFIYNKHNLKGKTIYQLMIIKWAASWQNQHNGFATSMDPDQPVRPRSLIRIHAVRYQFLYFGAAQIMSYNICLKIQHKVAPYYSICTSFEVCLRLYIQVRFFKWFYPAFHFGNYCLLIISREF